ncbi:MAG TPA: AtzE family amidohydrolase [Burkholderiales bacterium]|nr:AtzE family amidohydrolase [Burkholderiales bacterium]
MNEFEFGALEAARAIRQGELSATELTRHMLERIEAKDHQYNSFTDVTAERALAEAHAVDAQRARGETLPPLAGVPYAVKNLYDVERLVTLAGSKINRDRAPAIEDATLVKRMKHSGAILLGALNMDEYAYGFTTENTHYGPCRNPHDTNRTAGGSSGGCSAAVAGGLAPLTLGSDTNGSIRVPASLCGIFGLKPTFGRLSRWGTYPFVASLDHLGPFARSAEDLAACYDALQYADAQDHACAQRGVDLAFPQLLRGIEGLRIAVASAYFHDYAGMEAREAVADVAQALGATRTVEIPQAHRARAAAFLITASEGGALHLPDLRTRPDDFDPNTRDRLIAGVLTPAAWVYQAQRFRNWYRERVLEIFKDVDLIIAPATPVPATPLGQENLELHGQTLPLRPSMGLLTQPISFIGLPVVAAPVAKAGLPLGVQLIAAPWREDIALRVAHYLETMGVCAAPLAASAYD